MQLVEYNTKWGAFHTGRLAPGRLYNRVVMTALREYARILFYYYIHLHPYSIWHLPYSMIRPLFNLGSIAIPWHADSGFYLVSPFKLHESAWICFQLQLFRTVPFAKVVHPRVTCDQRRLHFPWQQLVHCTILAAILGTISTLYYYPCYN